MIKESSARVSRLKTTWPSLLGAAGRGGNVAGAHEIADIFLQEPVVVVEFVVLLADGLDAVEDCEERLLQGLCMPMQLGSSLPSQLINILAGASWAHGADIIGSEVGINGSDGGAIAWDGQGTTALAAGQGWTRRGGMMQNGLVRIGGRRRSRRI